PLAFFFMRPPAFGWGCSARKKRTASLSKRSYYPLSSERHIAQPHAKGVIYRVRDRSRRGPLRCFASAKTGLAGTVDHGHLDLRCLGEREDGIVLPTAGQDALRLVLHLLLQRPASRLYDAALGLIDETVGIDRPTCLERRPGALDPDLLGDLDFNQHRRIGGKVFVPGETHATSAAVLAFFPLAPT